MTDNELRPYGRYRPPAMPMGSDLGDTESGSTQSRVSMVEIGRVDAKPTCVQACIASVCPETPGRQSAGQTAPVLPDALAECARPRACSPRTVSKWTKVGRVDAMPICVRASERPETQGRQPALQIAPVLSNALAECARTRACSPRTVSKWTKVGRVDAMPICVRASV